MNYRLFFIFLCAFLSPKLIHASLQAEPCSIELYSEIYKFNSTLPLEKKDLVRSSNCREDIIHEFLKKAILLSGKINASSIEKEYTYFPIHITPRTFFIGDINTFLKMQLIANEPMLTFMDSQPLDQKNAISILENEKLHVECDICTRPGEKNLKLTLFVDSSPQKTIWITSKLFQKIKALKIKRNISFQEKKLGPEDFLIEEISTLTIDNLVTNLDKIEFFAPTRTLQTGTFLTTTDLRAVNLVEYGSPVKVILKNSQLSLSKTFEANKSGQYGDNIELKSNTHKTIMGKIIDYNLAVIEL